jgi:putative oxidoreductase
MWITTDDFKIKAENFDLTDGFNILRIACGAFMFPHVASKFAAGAVSAGTASFFAKAGFQPPEIWVCLAALGETAAGIALVLGICTRFAALGATTLLIFAVYALHMVKGFGWTWNTGGYEYPIFWAIACFAVATEAWNKWATQTTEPGEQPPHGAVLKT